MAKTNKADMSCARVKQYTAFDVSKAERHNERKNETYENMNVITERIALNVHFKKPTVPTYMEQLKQMETDGLVSLRGLRKDATLFNEIVIDVNGAQRQAVPYGCIGSGCRRQCHPYRQRAGKDHGALGKCPVAACPYYRAA